MSDDEVDERPEETGSRLLHRRKRGERAAARAELRRRDALLRAVTDGIAEILTADSIRAVLPSVMEGIASVARIDGMHIVEESDYEVNPRSYYSWRRTGVHPRRNLYEVALDVSLDEALYEWLAPLRAGRAVFISRHGSIGPLPPILATVNLTSLLLVPIMVRHRHWGSVSFDDCDSEHVWAEDEINVLHLFADLLGAAITRERYVEDLSNANTIIQNSPTILYRLRGEPSFPMVYVSQNVARLGYAAAELIRVPTLYQRWAHPEDRQAVHAALAGLLPASAPSTAIEHRLLTGDGLERWVESRYTPVRDAAGRLLEVEAVMIDVTERKAAEQKIARLARTDALTGLANRGTFVDRLKQVFASRQRGGASFALLYLDLDRFKEINDTLGHPAGDCLLREAAERLRALVRRTDLAARLGGDEFAVLQTDVPEAAAAGILAEKIIAALSAPYRIEERELKVGVSVGIAICTAEDATATSDDILARADRALYRSKESGRGRYHFHTAQLDHDAREHVELANDLREAIRDGRLELHYQAQVELSSGRMTGMEALARWPHPRLGLLLPHAFLPIAERNGLMRALGAWVLDRACRQLREWRDEGNAVPLIAVNLGLAHVRAGSELVEDVKRSLARWRLAPRDLELDVTESILARTTLAQNPVLEELHGLGVHIAIDDFGSQYSTLDYLRTYRVSRLKIARSIVSAAVAEEPAAMLVRAIMSLAKELGVEVIAEGVETEAQRAQLLELDVRAKGQGFYFSTPAPAQKALQQLREPEGEGRTLAGAAQDAEGAAGADGPSKTPQRMRTILPPEDS